MSCIREVAAIWAVRAALLGILIAADALHLATAQTPPPPEARPGIPSDAELEESGAVIGRIVLNIANIFNEADPREDKALYRLANRLHIKTREDTVRSQLLFKTGDRYDARLLQETERNLRALDYLHDAHIRPFAYDGQHVDVIITTRDVWSLQPGISFSRKGGANEGSVELEEENLFGRGKDISLSWSQDVQRESILLRWRDRNVFQSRWQSDLAYSINDDGRLRQIAVDRPFFALDTRWSAGGALFDFTRVDPRYDLGHIVDEFRHDQSFAEIRGGWSAGLVKGRVLRWISGFTYDDNEFSIAPGVVAPVTLPPDRKLVYPWVGISSIQDKFATTENFNKIGRTEDLDYGTNFSLRIGWADESLGSDRNAAIISGAAHSALEWDGSQTLFLNTAINGRLESGSIANGILAGDARYYWRWSPKRVFYAGASGVASEALDPENQIQLGGDNGLRGYPLRYQTGSSRALFTVEQRFFTDWFPFRLFYVGAAVFADVGRTWGHGSVGAPSLGWLSDVGIGLRLGNARSGFGSVVHIDIAFPLNTTPDIDKVQLLLETKDTF
ncbi:MAG TPA: BamA/TamA family outer membrane protein [Steroidobacteraceae bacterium]|nr:BamA/TamA family outer membrane protein [Steroidobacteraceae bacterium]